MLNGYQDMNILKSEYALNKFKKMFLSRIINMQLWMDATLPLAFYPILIYGRNSKQ